jgi:hypothetical protein
MSLEHYKDPVRRHLPCFFLVALVLGGSALAAQPTPILISPVLPTTSDPVVLVVEPTCNDVFQPPTIVGKTITLQVGPLIPAGPCPVTFRYPLGTLAAGSYTVKEVDFFGALLSSSVFQVNAPTTQLNLLAGRFAVTANWFFGGGTPAIHTASAVQLADGSGYLWFVDPGSIELSVKIIDGSAINGHFWVFVASSTNLGFNLTVTDTVPAGCSQPGSPTPCTTRTYSSSPGSNQNFFDFGTFANPAHP